MTYKPKGFYFEEFKIGQSFISQGRTITEADVSNFAGLSGDFNPLHTDAQFAKTTLFGQRIAHGMLGASIMTGMSNQLGIFEGTTLAFLSLSMDYKSPLYVGDTIHLELTPLSKKLSSKPNQGIIKFQANLLNQNDKAVIEALWTIMMKTQSK